MPGYYKYKFYYFSKISIFFACSKISIGVHLREKWSKLREVYKKSSFGAILMLALFENNEPVNLGIFHCKLNLYLPRKMFQVGGTPIDEIQLYRRFLKHEEEISKITAHSIFYYL